MHSARRPAQPPQRAGGKDFLASLNPENLKTVTAYVEPSLAQAAADDKFQFERHGQFGYGITSLREVSLRRKAPAPCVADCKNRGAGKPVFNRVTWLKDSWGR